MYLSADHKDWKYFIYPFRAHVFHHTWDEVVFSGQKHKYRCPHYMYGFVVGVPYEWMTTLGLAELPSGEGDGPHIELEESTVTVQALRPMIAGWRNVLFNNEETLAYLLTKLRLSSHAVRGGIHNIDEQIASILDWGLFDHLKPEELTKRRAYWEMVKRCYWDCPSGLDIRAHKSDFRGLTSYELTIIYWRIMLNEQVDRDGPDFKEWLMDVWPPYLENYKHKMKVMNSRLACMSCRAGCLGKPDRHVAELITEYLSRHRPKSIDQFYQLYVSAFISAVVKMDFVAQVDVLHNRRVDEGLDQDKEEWQRYLYGIDTTYQTAVRQVCYDMSIKLAEHNGAIIRGYQSALLIPSKRCELHMVPELQPMFEETPEQKPSV